MTFDQETSLRLVGEALSLVHLLGDVDQITVRQVSLIDQSLTVEVLATSDDPILLRGQAASVMGGLSGLDVPDLFPALNFTNFAVRLVNHRGDDVFWIISSPQDAKFAETGAVRWLANSVFQDNTPAYRRSQADRLIAQLEKGLRDLLHLHWHMTHGNGYISTVLTSTLLKDLRRMARREGEDEHDDRTLLDYTLLPQLAASACDEALLTTHGCVHDSDQLKEDLAKLNKIRRKVAHHRDVTVQDLEIVRTVVAGIFRPLGERHPDLIMDFLAERWDDAVQTLMKDLSTGMQTEDPPEAGTVPETERQAIAARMLEQQLAAAKRGQSALGNLVVPAVRKSIHDLVELAFRRLVDALGDIAVVARQESLNLAEALAAQDRHAKAMEDIRKLGEEVERIRVLEHSVR